VLRCGAPAQGGGRGALHHAIKIFRRGVPYPSLKEDGTLIDVIELGRAYAH
jgi:hypothetical protein